MIQVSGLSKLRLVRILKCEERGQQSWGLGANFPTHCTICGAVAHTPTHLQKWSACRMCYRAVGVCVGVPRCRVVTRDPGVHTRPPSSIRTIWSIDTLHAHHLSQVVSFLTLYAIASNLRHHQLLGSLLPSQAKQV